jgi:hypothetical protein
MGGDEADDDDFGDMSLPPGGSGIKVVRKNT